MPWTYHGIGMWPSPTRKSMCNTHRWLAQLLGMKPISACLGPTWVPPYELPAEEETEAWEEVWGTRR